MGDGPAEHPAIIGDAPDLSLSLATGSDGDWKAVRDDQILRQQDAIREAETSKMHLVGDKEPLSALAAEYESGNSVFQDKIKLLGEQYSAIRRTRGDGNCFFRSFMFAYLEHVFKFQDSIEVARMKESVEQCKNELLNLGYAEFTFEDFFAIFLEQLDDTIQKTENALSDEELLRRARDQSISDYVVMFFRFITTGEIRRRAEFFEPFILGLSDKTVDLFCKTSVEPMGEESDHIHITALSDALGVPIRVEYLDRSSSDDGVSMNHHDFLPSTSGNTENLTKKIKLGVKEPFITLLYRPGHYDILYSKNDPKDSGGSYSRD